MKTNNLIILSLLLLFVSCTNDKYTQIRDEQNKTFFVNGISAIEGVDKVYESLKEYGYTMEEPEECDLTYVGGDFTTYANCYAPSLTEEQASRITYGLFDNLKGITSKDIIIDDMTGRPRIYLDWYKSGEIKKIAIGISGKWTYLKENEVEVHKRLNQIFPHNHIANKRNGFKAYTDDNDVELYITPELIEIEKKNPNSKF